MNQCLDEEESDNEAMIGIEVEKIWWIYDKLLNK